MTTALGAFGADDENPTRDGASQQLCMRGPRRIDGGFAGEKCKAPEWCGNEGARGVPQGVRFWYGEDRCFRCSQSCADRAKPVPSTGAVGARQEPPFVQNKRNLQNACDALPWRCSTACYSARRHVEVEAKVAKEWRPMHHPRIDAELGYAIAKLPTFRGNIERDNVHLRKRWR